MQDNNEFPKIPDIIFTATKGEERFEFKTVKELEEWIIEECDRELYDAYRFADSDETRGCDGMKEWVHFCVDSDELTEFAEGKGWKIERVVK